MHKFFFFLLSIISFTTFGYAAPIQDQRSHFVIVSITPYKYFVEAIGGNTVKVGPLVPPDTSFHHYEPTPKLVLQAGTADIWFRIGESFEGRAIQALTSHYPNLKIVDLRDHVDLITVGHEHRNCCHAEGADLHIWLSARQAKIQATDIAKALMEVYPENKQLYQDNLDKLLKQLDELDAEIIQILKPLQNRTIMVAHPAYAYFARDYQITQLPIEYEGKDPSSKQLMRTLEEARAAQVKTIFIQKEYSPKGPYLVAKELGANIVELNPYSGDYFVMMRSIAQRIAAKDQISSNPR
jgi:zinc transport system substrate-binding protein